MLFNVCIFYVILQVLVAITLGNDSPTLCFKAFDVESKSWKHLTCINQPQMKALHPWSWLKDTDIHLAAKHIGNHLYVAVNKCFVYRYSIDQNLWEELPRSPCSINSLCAIGDYMYALGNCDQVPQRYSFSECRWQPIAKVSDCSNNARRYSAGATVFDSKLYVLFGRTQRTAGNNTRGSNVFMQKAMLYCFDPSMNRWEFLSYTCEPHFGSTLFVANDKLCVAGGCKSPWEHTLHVYGEVIRVEVYNAEAKYWLTVHQSHIPLNCLGAIEVEGRVYFIINNFPIDSGIRIPPGERYPVHLGKWGKWRQVDRNAVLCYLPVKRKP